MVNVSTLEKAVFEFTNMFGDICVIGGIGLLIAGDWSGPFYLTAGLCGNLTTLAHESAMKYPRKEMFTWSKIKYSHISPFKYIGTSSMINQD